MMAMSIRPSFSPPAGCGMHFLKKPAATMASYTGPVARNRSSAVGSNSAALAPASTSVANRRDSSWSSRCCGVSVKSIAMETFLNLIDPVYCVIRLKQFQRDGGRATCSRLLPAAGGPAAVDMKDLAGDERRLLQIHHGVGDLLYLTHSAHRLQPAEKAVRLRRMHRRLDRSWRNGIHPNMTAGIFDRERARDRVEPAFGQRRKRGCQCCHRLFGNGLRDVDDVARAHPQHPACGLLRHMKESREIYGDHRCEVLFGILGEMLGDEDASVVDKGIYSSEALGSYGQNEFGRLGAGNVTLDHQDCRIVALAH